MDKEYKKITFKVTGDFVTETARRWFFAENKSYEKVEEFLLECMCGTDTPVEKLKLLAQDVLLGRSKFVGNTGDGSYAYTEDDIPVSVFEYINKIQGKLSEAESELNDITKKYIDLADGIRAESLDEVEYNSNRQLLKILLGDNDNIVSTGSNILDTFLEADKYDDNYGWIKPDGEFIPVEFAEHQDYAKKYIEDNGLQKEYDDWFVNGFSDTTRRGLGIAGDFLVYKKGWVLLHNPSQGIANPTYDESKGITKEQRTFLFDYYIARDKEELANKYWQE